MPDFVIGRRGREPSSVDRFRQEVPFRTDYADFRLEVVTHRRTRRGQVRPIRERMIFDERPISDAKRAEGYRYYPEVLIDERPDLRHIHAGFTDLGTEDGQLVRLEIYLVRGEDPSGEREGDDWVLAIRVATVGIQRPPPAEPPDPEPEITDADVEAAKRKTLTPMRIAVTERPSDAGAGWSIIGYSEEQLGYMEWLEGYLDNMKLVLRTSPEASRMHDDWSVEPHLFPEIAAHRDLEVSGIEDPVHPYWEGPAAYPIRLHAANSVLTVWNTHLDTIERRAAHARHLEIIRQLDFLYRYARKRITE